MAKPKSIVLMKAGKKSENTNAANDLRCVKCNKKLAEGMAVKLSIKCPRCGLLNEYKASNGE